MKSGGSSAFIITTISYTYVLKNNHVFFNKKLEYYIIWGLKSQVEINFIVKCSW